MFGSAARSELNENSDYDFLVEFDPNAAGGIKSFMDLKFSLESLFGRPVDLVEESAVVNRTFLRSANKDRVAIYSS